MQPKELTIKIAEINQELNAGFLSDYLRKLSGQDVELTSEGRTEFRTNLFSSYQGFVRCNEDETKHDIMNRLGLHEIFQDNIIAQMLGLFEAREGNSPKAIIQNPDNIELFETVIVSLKILKHYAMTLNNYIRTSREPKKEESAEIIDFEIVENENELTVESFIAIFRNIQELYTTIAEVYNDFDSKLTIVFIESGTSFKFSLKGAEKVAKELIKVLGQIWDTIIFQEFKSFDRSLESITKAVSLVGYISEQEKSKKIDSHKAGLLKEKILANSMQIIEKGVLPSELLESGSQWNNKTLLAEKVQMRQLESPKKGNAIPDKQEVKKLKAPKPLEDKTKKKDNSENDGSDQSDEKAS